MRKTTMVVLLALCLVSTGVIAADKTVTVKGEIVDAMCYAAMDAKGEGHAKCGIKCAKAGMPVGLVDGAKMYILLPPHDAEPLPAAAIDSMGKVASVTGHLYTSGGVSFLTVESVK